MDIENRTVIFQDYLKRIVTMAAGGSGNLFCEATDAAGGVAACALGWQGRYLAYDPLTLRDSS
jgi:hypothetical protein